MSKINFKVILMNYIAHKQENERQSIIAHLTGTAKLCHEFAKGIQMSDYAYLTGLLHDIGKYSEAFQRRINGSSIRTDHSTAGAKEALLRQKLAAAFAIAGHHGGIPDCGYKTDCEESGTFLGRMKKVLEDYSDWKSEQKNFEFSADEPANVDNFIYSFYVRMIFSCLVDADFLDTELFMSGGKIKRYSGENITQLLNKLEQYTSKWNTPDNELNMLRNQIRRDCIESGINKKENIFSLTVPTGGGKTISSLAFALNYAKKNQKKRVIYVIPYTSIIEQNAEVFRDVLGNSNVIEHHSNIDYKSFYDENNATQAMLACENWDAPVIVTTAVQFFESVYSNKPSDCRKLHNITDSVIIFDEAQMIPIDYLYPCISAMWFLADKCNSSVVLCTATQPCLEPYFKMCSKDESLKIQEICRDTEQLFCKLKRTTFSYDGKIEDDELAARISEHNQVLCILNSKNHTESIYSMLNNDDGNFCLTTHMYPEHRKKKLNEIRQRLKDNKTCRVISTSLIEAGVDVDFPTVYRAIAGIDSILQAGGRCNRENHNPASESIVHIFDTDIVVDSQKVNVSAAKTVLKKFGNDIDNPKAVSLYFETLYYYLNSSKDFSAFDRKQIIKYSKNFEFEKVSKAFKMIDNNTRSIYINTDESSDYITKLRKKEYSRELFQKLQRYSVNIYEYEFNKLYDNGAIETIDDSFYVLVKINSIEFYNKDIGLIIPDSNIGQGLFH